MKKSLFFVFLSVLSVVFHTASASSWVKTEPSALKTGDVVAIVDVTSSMALPNSGGTSSAPVATPVILNSNQSEITSMVDGTLQWAVTASGTDFQFCIPNTSDYLYCTDANNGLRVGIDDAKIFEFYDNKGIEFLRNKTKARYLGVYNNQDWRCYTTISTNIAASVITFFKKVDTDNYYTIPKENVVLQSAAYNYRLCKDVNFSDLTINGKTMGVDALTFDASITTDEIRYNGYIPYQCSVEGLENLWCAMTTPSYTAGRGLQTNGSGPRGLLLGNMKKDQIIVFEGANGGYNTGKTDENYNGFCIPNGSRYSGGTEWTWELFDPLQVEDISTEIHTKQNEIAGGDAYSKYLYLRVLQDGWVSIPMERSAWIYGYQIWDKTENPVPSDFTSYIANAGFEEDLTFQKDGTMKGAVSTTTSLSDRSWAYIAEDGTVYARPKETSTQSRPDGRKLEAVNGFKGSIQGWTMESNSTFPACEWTYFGTIPYDLAKESVPIADDGSTYLEVPARPTEFDGGDGFVYFKASWTNSAVYKQIVNLPSAKYRFEYWTINLNPGTFAVAEDLTQIVCCQKVFREEGGLGLQKQEWTKHSFDFISAGECSIQFGYKAGNAGSGGMPIVALDGIRLYKIGEANEDEILEPNENAGDILSLSNQTFGKVKKLTLPIAMTNTHEITAFQFEVSLPTGFSLEKSVLTDRMNDQNVSFSKLANGNYQVVAISLNSKAFKGTEGVLVNLTLNMDEGLATGNYTIHLKNIELTTTEGGAVNPADVSATLTISNTETGDVNGDGKVTITDAVAVVNYILGHASAGFVSAAADVNGDGKTTITDAVAIVNMILNQGGNAKMRGEAKELDPQ
ncbi:MAG: dockerin type I repeat-containing protein [Bacteroidaceae bacterium]|nr:dockerin type I repeat-containing protein [Bacteroidaceae bacterium]